MRKQVPERRKMKKDWKYGMAIGNLTAQAGSNLNLCDFDNYVIKELKLEKYVRYVDDLVIIADNKSKLISSIQLIKQKLKETQKKIKKKKQKWIQHIMVYHF